MNVIYLKSWVDVNTSLIFLLFYTVYKDLLYYIHSDIYLGQVIWRSWTNGIIELFDRMQVTLGQNCRIKWALKGREGVVWL